MIAIDLPDEAATAASGGARRRAGAARRRDRAVRRARRRQDHASPAPSSAPAPARREEVPSPTFTLVQIYELPRRHGLAFRPLSPARPEEAWELGIEDAFADGISLIEWPERLGDLLPARRLDIALDVGPEPGAPRRRSIAGVRLAGAAAGSARRPEHGRARRSAIAAFLAAAGWGAAQPRAARRRRLVPPLLPAATAARAPC